MRTLWAILLAAAVLTAAPSSPQPSPEAFWSVPLWLEPADATLTASDLAASVNNQPAKIVKLLRPESDLVILMVLDLTGDLALVQPAKESLAAQLDKLPSNTWVGLLNAQGDLAVLADPTGDHTSVATLIRDLPISGKAGLLDTLEPVATLADHLLHKSDVRVAVPLYHR